MGQSRLSGKTFIIAEAGVNHNGSLEQALRLVDAAVRAGADAVKIQTFQAEQLASPSAPKAAYQSRTTPAEESQLEMIRRLQLSDEAQLEIQSYCREQKIVFLTTPMDPDSLNFVTDTLDLEMFKLGSGDLTNGPLLLKAGQAARKIILSTGMSNLEEVAQALGVLAFGLMQSTVVPGKEEFDKALRSEAGKWALRNHVTLLHCTTAYPTPFHDVNLRAMDAMSAAFNLPVGLSDHTPGISVAVGAVARGAKVIEKHLTLDHKLPGPDHRASLEPDAFHEMVKAIREVEQALGEGGKTPTPSELVNVEAARKSLFAARPIAKGKHYQEEDFIALRPGTGISPMDMWQLIGQKAEKSYQVGEMIQVTGSQRK
ncbi:MAG: N-acetylneuraminate synthase [Magnetococcales bacterium]|nr:N-acetylneuraminate synthase [Magnetococcales bacterium]NGZ26169.1 N-acetylneuraminate synthase [Magnetococcales bacterium]